MSQGDALQKSYPENFAKFAKETSVLESIFDNVARIH